MAVRIRVFGPVVAAVAAAVVVSACGRAQAKARTPGPMPVALAVPEPPSRLVLPVSVETPTPTPSTSDKPATTPSPRPSGAVRPTPTPTTSPSPTPEPTPTPVLSTMASLADLEARARERLDRAEKDLGRVSRGALGADARDQWDNAARFIRMAKDAIAAKNFVYAAAWADKAATLAALLVKTS
jgi:hypothetical protein